MNRRELLLGLGLVGLAMQEKAAAMAQRDTLIVVFLRGGADSLSLAVPYNEANYYAARPALAVRPPGEASGALDLDGQFGLHPAMAALQPLYSSGQLAIVQAAGLPHGSRSHFEAQDRVESGHPQGLSPLSGWLGRHIAGLSDNPSPLRCVSLTGGLPVILRGDSNAIALRETSVHQWLHQMPGSYVSLLESSQNAAINLGSSASAGITLAETLDSIQPWQIPPAFNYPKSKLGDSLSSAAQLIKSGAGTEVIHISALGWDTHDAQDQSLPGLLNNLAGCLAAFYNDLGSAMQQVTVLVMSEFGRRVAQNANNGTDHGRGGCLLAMGGGVNGGRVYGSWPGLEADNLVDGDLAITTDYRQLLVECLYYRRAASNLDQVFPGFSPGTDSGLFAAV